MISIIYKEWCDLSNHFGEHEDEKWLEEKIKWYEDMFIRVLVAMVWFHHISKDEAVNIVNS